MDFSNFDYRSAQMQLQAESPKTEADSVVMRDKSVAGLQEAMGPDPVVPESLPINGDTAAAALEGGDVTALTQPLDKEDRMLMEASEVEKDLGGRGMPAPDYSEYMDIVHDQFQERYEGGTVENTLDFLSTFIPVKSNYRLANALAEVVDIDAGTVAQWVTTGGLQDKVFNIIRDYTPEQRVAAIKRIMPAIEKNSGDNNTDAKEILDTLSALFGSRSQAEASRDTAYAMSTLAIGAELLGAPGVVKGIRKLTKPARSIKKLVESRVAKKAPHKAAQDASEGAVEGVAIRQTIKDVTQEQDAILSKAAAKEATKEGDAPLSALIEEASSNFKKAKKVRASRAVPRNGGVSSVSLMSLAGRVAPRMAEDIAEKAIKDPSVARQMGTKAEDIATEYATHRGVGEVVTEGPDLVKAARGKALTDDLDEILKHGYDELALSAEDLAKLEDRASRVEELKMSGFDVSKSSIHYDKERGRLAASYVYRDTGGKAFETAEDAINKTLERVDMTNVDKIEVMRMDRYGDYHVASPKEGAKGSYRMRLTYVDNAEKFVGKDKGIFRERLGKNWFTNGVDTLVAYNRRIADSVTGLDLSSAQLNRKFAEILQPFQSLNKSQKAEVWKVLQKGAKDKKTYNRRDLADLLDGDEAAMRGYEAVRKQYDISWELRNRQFRDLLSRQGFIGLDVGTGLDDIVRKTSKATRKDITDRNIEVMYKGKATLMKDVPDEAHLMEYHRTLEMPNGGKLDYIAVDKAGMRISALPDRVMNVTEGYMGRHLDTRYVVRDADGTAKGFYKNSAAARAAAAKGKGLVVHRAKELGGSGDDLLEDELNTLADMGMLSHTKRRTDPDLLAQGHEESLMDPTEAMNKVTNQMARGVTLDRWAATNTKRWRETYGKYLDDDSFPWGDGKVKLKAGLEDRLDHKAIKQEAENYAEKIRLVTGRHESNVDGFIKTRLRRTAEATSELAENVRKRTETAKIAGDPVTFLRGQGWLTEKTSNVLTSLADPQSLVPKAISDPVNAAKNLGFIRSILANPIKQRVMNSAQGIIYAGLSPDREAFSGQMMYILRRLNMGNLDKAAVKKGAHNLDEASEQVLKEMDESGLLASATTHDFLVNTMKLGGKVHATKGLVTKYGFEAGERVNLVGAYVAVRQAAVEAGEDIVPRTLAIKARQVAGNMGSYNRAKWQTGTMSALTQFMSFGVRQAQLILPDTRWTSTFANPVLSGTQKVRLGVLNTLMWGTSGWGVTDTVVDMLRSSAEAEGVEEENEVTELLRKGINGYLYDTTLQLLTGQEVNTSLSENLAPFAPVFGDVKVLGAIAHDVTTQGGDETSRVQALTPAGKLAAGAFRILYQHDWGALEDAFGVPIGAVDSSWGVATNVASAWMNPGLTSGDALRATARHIGNWAPVFSNATKGRMMAASGKAWSKYGDPITDVSLGEALTQGILGIAPTDVGDFYDVRANYQAAGMFKEPKASEVEQAGKDAAKVFHQNWVWQNGGDISIEDYQNRGIEMMNTLHDTYPGKQRLLRQSMLEEMDNLFLKAHGGADQALIDFMTSTKKITEVGKDRVIKRLNDLPESEYRNLAIEQVEKTW